MVLEVKLVGVVLSGFEEKFWHDHSKCQGGSSA